LILQPTAAAEQLRSGANAAEIAETSELAVAYEQLTIDRQSAEFDRGVVSRIFALPQPDSEVVTDLTTQANGDELALRLDAVQIPEAETTDAADDAVAVAPGTLEAGGNPRLGGTEFEVFLQSLRSKADINLMGNSTQ